MSQTPPEEFTEDFTDELTDQAADEPQELFYPDAETWVQDWLLPHYRRNPQRNRWDPQWWRYEEISALLESLWEAWEQMRWKGATGIIVLFRDYLWQVMDLITSDPGPLWRYPANRSRNVPDMWVAEPAPQGYFTDQYPPSQEFDT